MPLQAGTSLGPYQIDAPLGAGGMGEVYEATDTRLDRTVAIKVVPAHVANDPDLRPVTDHPRAELVRGTPAPRADRTVGGRLSSPVGSLICG